MPFVLKGTDLTGRVHSPYPTGCDDESSVSISIMSLLNRTRVTIRINVARCQGYINEILDFKRWCSVRVFEVSQPVGMEGVSRVWSL